MTGVRWVSASTVQVSWLARGGGRETHTLHTFPISGEVTTSQVSTGTPGSNILTKFDVMANKILKLSCQCLTY